MEEVSMREYFLILGKRIWTIVLITAISIAVSGVLSYFVLEPQYQTFTTLMVGKPKEYQNYDQKLDYNEVLLNQKLVTTYGELVKSRVVTDEVINNLGLDLSYKDFAEKVSVNLVKDTEIIKIEVTDTDPKLAAVIANETAQVFMKHVKDIMMVENVQVIDEARVPEIPVKPRPKMNMAIAGVLGLMISIFLVFLLEYLDNTIKTPEDIEKYLGLPVIGTIPKLED